jgi:hypothetical protein
MLLGNSSAQLIGAVGAVVLARLYTPSDFGQFRRDIGRCQHPRQRRLASLRPICADVALDGWCALRGDARPACCGFDYRHRGWRRLGWRLHSALRYTPRDRRGPDGGWHLDHQYQQPDTEPEPSLRSPGRNRGLLDRPGCWLLVFFSIGIRSLRTALFTASSLSLCMIGATLLLIEYRDYPWRRSLRKSRTRRVWLARYRDLPKYAAPAVLLNSVTASIQPVLMYWLFGPRGRRTVRHGYAHCRYAHQGDRRRREHSLPA